MNTYMLYLKSHCDAPDYDREFEAKNIRQAQRMFYQDLKGEIDYELCRPVRIYKNGKRTPIK